MTKEELLRIIEQAARDNATELVLSSNQLTELPPEIGQLSNLVWLDLSDNNLTTIPPEISQLYNLRRFNLSGNHLRSVPPEISQLTKLTELSLADTGLTEFPLEITRLTNLTILRLFWNKLTDLPPEIGQLAKLKRLDLESNELTVLTPEIGQLSSLSELNLRHNRLTELPSEIGQLYNLKSLDLRDNPLPIPPEILEKTDDPATIINYYLEHHVKVTVAEKKPLNEAKMLLVGQGGVGKTSLVKRLLETRFDMDERTTEGININQWNIYVDGKDVRLNVWDFGGQEIMHATHQFFLTKRSLYLLVLDARLGESENRVEYWLRNIQSFGGDSPVIIVGNKIDEHPLDIDRRGLQNKYPNIKAFIETSSLTGQGIEDLKAVITREIGALPHIHDELLNSWFNVKTRLEKMKENYISQEQYQQLSQMEMITNPLSQRTLLGFLHDLGIILNFQDDLRLQETTILNPEWVTNGVYRILNSRLLFENRGILERSMLNDILPRKEYPPSKHLFIMDMMRKFELCYDLEDYRDERFLIPDLLPMEEPYTGEWDGALAFEYHYNFLPGSIITRFIVRMHRYILQDTSWRTGVVLANRSNKALVKTDKEDRKIFIRITGPEKGRRPFLAIIRSQFGAIHDTISRIEVDEKVPLPAHPDIVEDYLYLLDLEALGEADFLPRGLMEKISVKALLDSIEPKDERLKRRARRLEEFRPSGLASLPPEFESSLSSEREDRPEPESSSPPEKESQLEAEFHIPQPIPTPDGRDHLFLSEHQREERYPVWAEQVRTSLLQKNSASLTKFPKRHRMFILNRFRQNYDYLNLTYDSDTLSLQISERERLTTFRTAWDEADRLVKANRIEAFRLGPTKELTRLFCEALGFEPLKGKDDIASLGQLHGQLIDASNPAFRLNVRASFPVIYLCKTIFRDQDINNARGLLVKFKISANRFALLIAFDDAQHLLQMVRESDFKNDFIVLSQDQFWEILAAKSPIQHFSDVVLAQIDLLTVSPYTLSGPVSEKVFFGRAEEEKTLLQNISRNSYVLLANRKMGKTSLLNKIAPRLEQDFSVFYTDLQSVFDYESFYKEMEEGYPEFRRAIGEHKVTSDQDELSPSDFSKVIRKIKDRHSNRQIILIFDEVDELLAHDLESNEILFKTFRSLAQREDVRFIFSGTTTLVERVKHPDSPFFNFCEAIRIGHLDQEAAYKLVTVPMGVVGVKFDVESKITERILAVTAHHPNMIQYICRELIKIINKKEVRLITEDDLEKVIASQEFYDYFERLIWGQAKDLEKLIVYTMWFHPPYTKKQVIEEFTRRGLATDDVEAGLHTLEMYTLLSRKDNRYHLTYEHFGKLIAERNEITTLADAFQQEVLAK